MGNLFRRGQKVYQLFTGQNRRRPLHPSNFPDLENDEDWETDRDSYILPENGDTKEINRESEEQSNHKYVTKIQL